MALRGFTIAEKPGLVATTTSPAGYVRWVQYDAYGKLVDVSPVIYEPERTIINLPASITLTALLYRGKYSDAYRGLDYVVGSDEDLKSTTGWENLRADHNASVDWREDHSVYLT